MGEQRSANWGKARTLYPSAQYAARDEWSEYFRDHPEALAQMLGDLYRVYKSEEEKRKGTSNPLGGRRKAHINGNLDELWSIITPRFSNDPFPVAVKALIGQESLRSFASRAGMDHRRIAKLMLAREDSKLDRFDLERIAKAGDVHPAYFLEWRVMTVTELLASVFAASPHLSITALKSLRLP